MENGPVDDIFAKNLINGTPADEESEQHQHKSLQWFKENSLQECVASVDSSSASPQDEGKSKKFTSSHFVRGNEEEMQREHHRWDAEEMLARLAALVVGDTCCLKYTTNSGDEASTISTSSLEHETKEEYNLTCFWAKADDEIFDDSLHKNSEAEGISFDEDEHHGQCISMGDDDHETDQHQVSNHWIEEQENAIRSVEEMTRLMAQVADQFVTSNNSVVPFSTSTKPSSVKFNNDGEQETNETLLRSDDQYGDDSNRVNNGDDNQIEPHVSKLIEQKETAIHTSEEMESLMAEVLGEFVVNIDSNKNNEKNRSHQWISFWSDEYQREYYYNIESKQVCWFIPRAAAEENASNDEKIEDRFYNSSKEAYPREEALSISSIFSSLLYSFLASIITIFFKVLAFLFATELIKMENSEKERNET